jgi:large subunit ribosomal protein L17
MAKYGKIGRSTPHRKATLRNMATELFKHERITTTNSKAKELRRYSEKLITKAKKQKPHTRRLLAKDITDRVVLDKLMTELVDRYDERNGGYTRILKLEPRRGDSTDMSIIELV